MGKIADILEQRGEIDEALAIHIKERLPVAEAIQDVDAIAHIRFSCARLRLARDGLTDSSGPTILEDLKESWELARRTQRLGAIAPVGAFLGQVLAAFGAHVEAAAVLGESAEAFERLGSAAEASELRRLAERLTGGS